jgi:hypothetical protein
VADVKNYKSLEHFAEGFPDFAETYATQVLVELHKANHREGKRLLEQKINAASVTGDLANSIRDADSSAGQASFLKEFGASHSIVKHPDSLTEPGVTAVISLDGGFHGIDAPRSTISKPYERGKRKGSRRRLGTDRAPRGFTTPAQQELLASSRQERLLEQAAKKAWQKAVAATV